MRVGFDQCIFVYLFFDARVSGSISVSDFSPPVVSFVQGGADTADVDPESPETLGYNIIIKFKPRYNVIAILRYAQYCDILYITIFPPFLLQIDQSHQRGSS